MGKITKCGDCKWMTLRKIKYGYDAICSPPLPFWVKTRHELVMATKIVKCKMFEKKAASDE